MSRKQAKTKSRPAQATGRRRNKLAYEMWLTKKAQHGPVEDRLAAEGLLLKDLQQRKGPKRSRKKAAKRKKSK
jgi:hypothetical protein